MIQCLVVLIWITLDNPEVEDVYCIRRHVKVCKWNALHMSLAEVYNVILAIVATLYAFLVRNVDSNFSESKWISYAMYSVCVSWMIDGVLLVFSVSETVSSQLSTLSQIPPEVSKYSLWGVPSVMLRCGTFWTCSIGCCGYHAARVVGRSSERKQNLTSHMRGRPTMYFDQCKDKCK